MMMNIIGYAQADSTQKTILVLKKNTTNKVFIIKENEKVRLYLNDNITVEGKLFRVGDTFVIVNKQKIGFSQISKIKYQDGQIAKIKQIGYYLCAESVIFSLGGFIIMNAGPGKFPDELSNASDFQLFGWVFFILGVIHIPPGLVSISIPYHRFNLTDKWQIVPAVQ